MQDASKIWQFGTRLKDELRRLQEQKLKAAGELDQRLMPQRTRIAFDDAKNSLIDQLARGDLLAAGRLKDSKIRLPQLITAEYWIGVDGFFPEVDQARSRQAHYTDVKVFPSRGDHQATKTQPDVTLTGEVAERVLSTRKSSGGRPNQEERTKRVIREMIISGELAPLANRTEQARQVRVNLTGQESSRHQDQYAELNTDTIKVWIGQVVKQQRKSAE